MSFQRVTRLLHALFAGPVIGAFAAAPDSWLLTRRDLSWTRGLIPTALGGFAVGATLVESWSVALLEGCACRAGPTWASAGPRGGWRCAAQGAADSGHGRRPAAPSGAAPSGRASPPGRRRRLPPRQRREGVAGATSIRRALRSPRSVVGRARARAKTTAFLAPRWRPGRHPVVPRKASSEGRRCASPRASCILVPAA